MKWERGGTLNCRGTYNIFFYGKRNENHKLLAGFMLCIPESYQQVRGLSLLVK
jgi:hypothetical protein